VLEAALQAIKQFLMKRVARRRKLVVAPQALLARENEFRFSQVRKMPGSGRLRNFKHRHQIAYTQFAVAK
jgi:hypothetical protein